MKQFKYIIIAVFALGVLASAVVVSAQGPMPQGTPPAGQQPRGTPPAGQQPPQGQPGQGQPGQGQPGQGQPPQGNQPLPGGDSGVVQAVTSSSLTVLRANNETFTAIISSTTRIELIVTQSTGTISDIQVGNNVTVDGRRNTDGTVAAVRILIEPSGTRAAGQVSAVSGATITLANPRDTVTVTTTTSTKFLKGKDSASLPDVTKGIFVTAYGAKQSDGSISATYVLINAGAGGPGQGQGQGQGQPARDQTPQAQPTRNQTPPAQPTRNQTLQVQQPQPPRAGGNPVGQPSQTAPSNQDTTTNTDTSAINQFVQWLLGLFNSR